jgi:D-aminopeptidase
MKPFLFVVLIIVSGSSVMSQDKRARDFGIEIGVLTPGSLNAITDVKGLRVGHTTLIESDSIRTGVTAVLPHSKNIYQFKVPAAIYIGNGYGKLAGYSQVEELGNIETPIILCNTLSVPVVSDALIGYTLNQEGNEKVRSVNPVVGETNDGKLNDIRGRHIKEVHVLKAIDSATGGKVQEGNVGAGTGTICFGYKGGIGTSSRVLPSTLGGYTVGVLVQTNFGGVLEINGVPIGKELDKFVFRNNLMMAADGSCMIIVATDAPIDSRNLKRIAKRAMLGLAKTGGIASNGSGDYVIAISTFEKNIVNSSENKNTQLFELLNNSRMSPLFLATIEATEEAIINSLFAAKSLVGKDGIMIESLPLKKVIELMKKYNKINGNK